MISNSAFAQLQFNQQFMQYLSQENKKLLIPEYISQSFHNNDSIHYFKAKFELQFGDMISFLGQIDSSKTLFSKDEKAIGFASCAMLRQDVNVLQRTRWFSNIELHDAFPIPAKILGIYQLKNAKPRSIVVTEYPTLIQSSIQNYKKSAMKSPIKAALLSALVPGLGKMYIGKFRIGFNAMFMNSLFALQTYESIRKFGMKSPLTIINMAFTSFFYASTIYGSYRDAQYFKQEKLQQVYEDASDFYSAQYYHTVY